MFNDRENCKIISAKYIDLPDGRLVGLADIEITKTGEYSKCLFFRSKAGKSTEVGLSLEAYDALKELMIHPNAGNGGQIALTKAVNTIEESANPAKMVWRVIPAEDVEAARQAAESDNITQAS